jgi:hemerythrin-like domain-containing protein
MLGVAVLLSTPALRTNTAAKLQILKANIATRYRTFYTNGLPVQKQAVSLATSGLDTKEPTPSSASVLPTLSSVRSLSTATALKSNIMASVDSEPASDTTKTPQALPEKLSNISNADASLPKLSAADFRIYNRLAVMMDAYHNHFRYTWNLLYNACTTGSRPSGMSLRAFLSQGLHLCHALTVHHTIEEQHIFPELAERMPAFAPKDHLISQHEMIHEGLEKLEEYLDGCRSGEKELRLEELKVVMDGFGKVLWEHLDDEVKMLGAESMRRFWTKEEILRMNW